MHIKPDDLNGPEIIALLSEHLQCMAEVSPPESRHALNLAGLRKPEITFWSGWKGQELLGCGALKELDARHGEIKSMRTAKAHWRKGVAARMLQHIISEAKQRGYHRLNLETGAQAYFEPARRLYRKFGFKECGPFAGYKEDPNSVFMTKELRPHLIGNAMDTRTEAIAYLNSIGFHAKARDWSLGMTIGVFSEPEQLSPALKIYRRMVYIYARDGLWSIYNPKLARPVSDDRRLSLQEACDTAVELLKQT